MKKLIIGVLLGLTVLLAYGEEEPKADICEICVEDSDCQSDLYCEELYSPRTGRSVGRRCIDNAERECKCGYSVIRLCLFRVRRTGSLKGWNFN